MIYGTIEVPRCWKRLISVNLVYADDQCFDLAIEGHPHMIVEEDGDPHSADDPNAYILDSRTIRGQFDNEDRISLYLNIGAGREYTGGLIISEDDDPEITIAAVSVSFNDVIEVTDTDNDKTYKLSISWIGEDPYEKGYPECQI